MEHPTEEDVRVDQTEELKLFWILIALFFVLSRVPPVAEYFSIDNVNLAFALEKFDPRIHQPQPPGYPFFVAFSRMVNVFFHDAAATFRVVSVLVTGLCIPLVFVLARRMFSTWTAKAATLLFLSNPVFWYAGLNGPLRPNLALFSLLAAYCSWRAWNGDSRFVKWGALAIGVGTGFRPEILLFMFPLWAVSGWVGTRSTAVLFRGLVLVAVAVSIKILMLVIAVGGVLPLWKLMTGYFVEQTRIESVVMGAALVRWMRQVNRVFIWNGLAVIGWVWVIPWFLRSKDRVGLLSSQSLFLLTWLLPGLTAQILTHAAAPGHTLFATPGLCIIGAYVLWAGLKEVTPPTRIPQARETALYGAVVFNILLFLNLLPVPTTPSTGPLSTIKNAVAYGVYETSINNLRWMDQVTKDSLKQIRDFTPKDRPAIIVSSDVHFQTWFMNWRIARYYMPDTDIWVIADQKDPPMALRIQRDKVMEVRTGRPVQIPVNCGGRILWLIEHDSSFYKELSGIWELGGGPMVLVTDVGSICPPFTVRGFEFVPH